MSNNDTHEPKIGKPLAIIKHGQDQSIVDIFSSDEYLTIRKIKSDMGGICKVVYIRLTLEEAAKLRDVLTKELGKDGSAYTTGPL